MSVETDQEPLRPSQHAVVFQPSRRFYLAFTALAALSLVVALDGTSLSVALPVIAEEIGGKAIDAFWAGTSFLLASTVTLPIYAAFSHIFGRKHITLIAVSVPRNRHRVVPREAYRKSYQALCGFAYKSARRLISLQVILFLVGCLVAGLARNVPMMLVGRTIQGIGGGGILALTNIILTDLVPLRYRGNWIGALAAMWAIGSVSGPVVGGALAHEDTWPWIFYLNLPFIGVSFVLVAFFVRLRPLQLSWMEKLARVDCVGSFVFVASTTSLLVPLTWAGVMYDWQSWRVVAPLGFALAGFIILGYHENFATAYPIIRKQVFANRSANIAYFTTIIQGMVLWTLLYYQPLYFQAVRELSPVLSGIALFPATFTVAPMAIVTGIFITKTGAYRWAVWGGWVLTTLGVGFMCAIDTSTQFVQVVLTDLCAGVGLGA